MGGLIFGTSQPDFTIEQVINFAASAAFGKLQEVGDSTKQAIQLIKSRF